MNDNWALVFMGVFFSGFMYWAHTMDESDRVQRAACQVKCGNYKVDGFRTQCVCDMTKVVK